MKCPHCGEELRIADCVERNMEAYRSHHLARTLCCGKGVTVSPNFSFCASKYEGPRTEDDWANEFSK